MAEMRSFAPRDGHGYTSYSVKGGVHGLYNFQDGCHVAIRDAPFGTHCLRSSGWDP